MDKISHPYFVPDGDSRTDTATLLVGTASEFGVSQRGIAAVRGGFRISQEVYDAVYGDQPETASAVAEPEQADDQPAPAPKKRTAKKTSGTRSAKNTEKE